MNFGNNIEKMAFEKGEWPFVEISVDGNTIYMGRPPHSHAGSDEPGWIIKRISIMQNSPIRGYQTIETCYANDPRNLVYWDNKRNYEYLPL